MKSVSPAWRVGLDLEELVAREALREELHKPIHVVPQFRDLYENAWQTFRRVLPDAPPGGRDPEPYELDTRALYLSADLPFATPQEISAFVRRATAKAPEARYASADEAAAALEAVEQGLPERLDAPEAPSPPGPRS